MSTNDLTYLIHIIQNAKDIQDFIENKQYQDFSSSKLLQNAIIRSLEVIGEALNKISPTTREQYPDIPWRRIIGLRNKLIHEYFGIERDQVWQIANKRIPELMVNIKKIVLPAQISLDSTQLKLKPISFEYSEEIFKNFTPEITQFMSPAPAKKLSETIDYIKSSIIKFNNMEDLVFVILNSKTHEYLGNAGIHKINTPTPELGVWIKKAAHGYGYGKEAIHTIYNWAKQNLTFNYLTYPVDRRNIASRKIPESLGGTIASEYKDVGKAGNDLDIVVYHIY